MADLKAYLEKLSTDGDALQSYIANPDEAMNSAGLSASDQDALRSRDRAKIASAIGGETAAIEVEVVITLKVKL